MFIASWRHLRCLSLNLALKSFNISSSSFGSFISLRAINSCSGSEERVLQSLGSSLKELESPSDASVELVVRLDIEVVEVDRDSRVGVVALITFAVVFFFFLSTGGQAIDDEPRPFSSGALLNFSSYLFFLLLLKMLLASLRIRLTCLFVKGKILQNKVLPGYHDLWQPPRDDVEDV